MRQSNWTLLGGGARRLAVVLALVSALAVVPTAPAKNPPANETAEAAFAPATLLDAARANPSAMFDVIVQGRRGVSSAAVAGTVLAEQARAPGRARGAKRKFETVNGTAAEVTGRQLVRLVRNEKIFAITPDAPVQLSLLSSRQLWPYVAGVAPGWWSIVNGSLPRLPAIAVVDSGIEAGRADFGGRVLAEIDLTSLPGNSAGDGRGHGTFVAGIAAGAATRYTGAAPSAPLVSIDVMNDEGMALTSDVIAAADWIYENREAYNIRVANFSLHTTAPASIFSDPLDRAVEKLWFAGVVVVAAAGNYGANGAPGGVPYAPGNDPFIITVGANDVKGTFTTLDDEAAPWSAYGYTFDGFAKPELAAPGRYLVGPVPTSSTLVAERPLSIVAPGYMQLSGTSFSAAAVSGAAAHVLGLHPEWTPDQVKGALMLTAKPTPSAAPFANGVGELDAARAALVTNPPNPNEALNRFVVDDPAGGARVFDAASWGDAALLDPAWNAASWGSASWGSASWGSASWGSASWGSASWSSASWGSASWGSASWGSASWGSASWGSTAVADNAAADAPTAVPDSLGPEQEEAVETELGIVIGPDGTISLVGAATASNLLLGLSG